MDEKKFLKEISEYTIDELILIFETQKDLYSEEEMSLIEKRIQELEEKEEQERREYIEKHLPKEIQCPKCDGMNPFENDTCRYCNYKLDKSKYYDEEYYKREEGAVESERYAVENDDSGSSYTFQYVISFLVPLVGFILGALLLAKDDEEEKGKGKTCIIIGLISVVISLVVVFVNMASHSSGY